MYVGFLLPLLGEKRHFFPSKKKDLLFLWFVVFFENTPSTNIVDKHSRQTMLRNEQSKMVQTLNDGPFCDKKSSADTKTIQNEDETEKKDTVDQPQSFWFTNIIYLVLLGVMIRVAGTFLEMDLRSLDQDVLDPKLSPFEKEVFFSSFSFLPKILFKETQKREGTEQGYGKIFLLSSLMKG